MRRSPQIPNRTVWEYFLILVTIISFAYILNAQGENDTVATNGRKQLNSISGLDGKTNPYLITLALYPITLVGAFIMHLVTVHKRSEVLVATTFLKGVFPLKPDMFYARFNAVIVVAAGSIIGTIAFVPQNPWAALCAGFSWIGAFNVLAGQRTTPSTGQQETTPSTGQQETTPSTGQQETTPSTGQQETTEQEGK